MNSVNTSNPMNLNSTLESKRRDTHVQKAAELASAIHNDFSWATKIVWASRPELDLRCLKIVESSFPERISYVSATDGKARTAFSREGILLDTLLENWLVKTFEPVKKRKHWETGEPLPAGPGPYGSGIRSLGSVDKEVIPDRSRINFPDDDLYTSEEDDSLLTANGPPKNWLAGGDDRHPVEPWCPIHKDGINGWARWLTDVAFKKKSPEDWSLNGGRIAYESQIDSILANLYKAWDLESALFFRGAHSAWDRYAEDPLSRDEVLGVIDNDRAIVVCAYRHRWYG